MIKLEKNDRGHVLHIGTLQIPLTRMQMINIRNLLNKAINE